MNIARLIQNRSFKGLLLTAGLLSTINCAWAQDKSQTFNSIELVPTVAYLNGKETPKRMVRLVFKQGELLSSAKVFIRFNGLSDSLTIQAAKEGISFYELGLPGAPINKTSQAEVTLVSEKQEYHARCLVEPARTWTMYILPHSHVDIGYTNTQAKVLKLHMNNIDESIKLAEKTENYPVGARYKWNTEAIWVVDNYLRLADSKKKERFWMAVKKGWINLDGAYGNINTSATDSRQLLMMFSRSRQLAKEHGIDINSMFQGDVPGASWGLAAQAAETGIKYFLSGPNAEDRIGNLARWQDKPFYWLSPSGDQKLLFWQCQPYSIGYKLKGSKIPNFFTVEDPKPYYTGKPSENFLDPYLFDYLDGLEKQNFPYDMSILTWALSDNAPIDPELPDAVKAWNSKYASPKLIITSTKGFFGDFEAKYKSNIPVLKGDYTEYWTDGMGSAAFETALTRNLSDKLKQADALWAIRSLSYNPAPFEESWKNLLLFNEHTWGAHNSVGEPDDPKVLSEWAVKKGYPEKARFLVDSLTKLALNAKNPQANKIDVFNTLSWTRTDLVLIPAGLSMAGDLVKDGENRPILSQRLSTGELAIIAEHIPPFGTASYTIYQGKAFEPEKKEMALSDHALKSDFYTIELDPETGNIKKLLGAGNGRNFVSADSSGLDQYLYLPGDSLEKKVTSGSPEFIKKEDGPLLISLVVKSAAPGCRSLSREIRLVKGLNKIEIINHVDKAPVRLKESVHFAFPFAIPFAQVRYSIPWGSAEVESDQLPYANRNWYTVQRWVDISNSEFGITLTTPDAPLIEIGQITTAGLLGGLRHSPKWLTLTPQSSVMYSWVMNNLWHTNFRADQEGEVDFRYTLHPHEFSYDTFGSDKIGLNDHNPLIVGVGNQMKPEKIFFQLKAKDSYVEEMKPSDDGKAVIVELVNSASHTSSVSVLPTVKGILKIWRSNLMEESLSPLNETFEIPAKGIILVRIERPKR